MYSNWRSVRTSVRAPQNPTCAGSSRGQISVRRTSRRPCPFSCFFSVARALARPDDRVGPADDAGLVALDLHQVLAARAEDLPGGVLLAVERVRADERVLAEGLRPDRLRPAVWDVEVAVLAVVHDELQPLRADRVRPADIGVARLEVVARRAPSSLKRFNSVALVTCLIVSIGRFVPSSSQWDECSLSHFRESVNPGG